jgi:hypothetical protein
MDEILATAYEAPSIDLANRKLQANAHWLWGPLTINYREWRLMVLWCDLVSGGDIRIVDVVQGGIRAGCWHPDLARVFVRY